MAPNTPSDKPLPTPMRLDRLDALRGLAMAWMTVFHFCFDLSYLRIWRQDFYNDPLWLWQRTAIVSLFLLCAGMGQAVALAQQVPLQRFVRRWSVVAGCALLVSLGSYWVFPQSYIYFGVLHGMAVMLLLLRGLRTAPAWLIAVLAVVCIALPPAYRSIAADLPADLVQALNSKVLSILGLVTHKPRTEDYVPLLPWLGVMLLGLLAGRHCFGRSSHQGLAGWCQQPAHSKPVSFLAWLGRHSLPYYMVHQLVLLGGLMLVVQLLR